MKKPGIGMDTYEEEYPWVIWHYGLSHDLWWPPRRSTRWTGHMKVEAECLVCGDRRTLRLSIPRVGKIKGFPSGRHPAREHYLRGHLHPGRSDPLTWSRPLANPDALRGSRLM
jgi:hypothetical protein